MKGLKKMKRAQIIKDSLYDYLKERGYSYISERDTWVFRKEEEEIRKEIVIHDMYNYAVRFDFATTVGGKEGIPYMDSSKVRLNDEGFCEYQNEEEFRIIIDEIKRVIVTKEEEIFSDISVISEEQRLEWEMQKQLFENHVQLIEQGKIFLGIKEENNETRLKMIIEKLKKLQGKTFSEINKELLILSAVFGEVYVEEFEGEWQYCNQCCGIKSKGVYHAPLNEVILYWEENSESSYETMISNYHYSVDKYNRFLKNQKMCRSR